MTENQLVGWHHQLDGHEFELALEVADGQGSPVCCSPWGRKELNMIERLNWTAWTEAVSYSSLPHGLQHTLSLTISQNFPKFKSIELVMPSNHLILGHPLLLLSIVPSITVFPNESAVHISSRLYKLPKVMKYGNRLCLLIKLMYPKWGLQNLPHLRLTGLFSDNMPLTLNNLIDPFFSYIVLFYHCI